MRWLTTTGDKAGAGDRPDDAIHVLPLDDLRRHETSAACWCRPKQDEEEPLVLVHNALDGREAFERGERAPS